MGPTTAGICPPSHPRDRCIPWNRRRLVSVHRATRMTSSVPGTGIRHALAETQVPALPDQTPEPPPRPRVRALKRHLIQSLRDLRVARRPERLIQRPAPEPSGFTATVLAAGCATCRGHCCKGGGESAV